MSILDTGEVCMEFLKEHRSQELVKEVLRISSDGNVVSIFRISSQLYKVLRVQSELFFSFKVIIFLKSTVYICTAVNFAPP